MFTKHYIPWNKGKTAETDERIKKLQVWKGKKNPGQSERMKGHIPWNKGIPCSAETKEKVSKSKKGKKLPPKWFVSIKKNIIHNDNYGMKGKRHSEESKERMSEATKKRWKENRERCLRKSWPKGSEHPNWLGGTSKLPYSFDFTDKLKQKIKERDNYTCKLCKEKKDLTIHHIDYDKMNCDEDNLATLCRKCNSIVNFNRKYLMNLLQNVKNGVNSGKLQNGQS